MTALFLLTALVLDACFGEPKWLWARFVHPIVLMGRLIGFLDTKFNNGPRKKLKGVAVMVGLSVGAIAAGAIPSFLPFGWIIELLLAAILIAHRSLVDHVNDVAAALRLSLNDARQSVARIVGRDTKSMDKAAVSRAAIESAAENYSDGVIAPAFWFLIGGLPGILLYKITNTADSMIGYRNDRYEDFGWAAAKFDDVLNWIPARLTAGLFAVVGGSVSEFRAIIADARKHRSPNAGWPEAALSRSLNVALAGPRSYDGKLQEFPFVNPAGNKNPGAKEIEMSTRFLWLTWGAILFLLLVLHLLTGY